MDNFKIENFCEEHNKEFKRYYKFLNSSVGYQLTLHYMSYLYTDRMKEHILKLIKKNYLYVIDKLNKTSIIVSFYKKNNLINKSEIGKFFTFYEKHIQKTNLKDNNQLLKLFYDLISYPECINVLKECFYIFSDYRSCIYFMTPSIDFNKVTSKNKILLKQVIHNFKDNLNTLNQIVSKVYLGDKTSWNSPFYTMAYSMFETLIILKRYFKDPLNELCIKFIIKKECNKKDIIKKLCENYQIKKFKESKIDDKINEKYVNNVSHFILILKRLGYDLWYVIYLVFDTIYPKYKLSGIIPPIIYTYEKLQLQIKNNELGVICFILTDMGFITNTNIFSNFND
jgi:hypothetical protein